MGKGSNTTQTNSSSSSSTRPDDNAYQAYLGLLNRASGVASTPYQGYGGEEVAPINQQQQAGFGAINTAQGAITATGAPISAADIQRYQDPYTNSVIDATQKDFDVQNARQQSQTTGSAAAQGALGGDRSAVAAALTAEGQSRSQAPVIAGLRSQGYQQAVKTAEDQQQQALRAGVAGLQGGQAMVGAGTLEQQTQQAKDTQDRLDYYQQQGYPFQVAQWLAQMTTGVGSQMGGTGSTTGTSTTQGPTPNPWAQVAGLGLAAAGTYFGGPAGGAAGAAAGKALFSASGGRVGGVHQFADGGATFDDRFEGEPRSTTWDHFKGGAKDFVGGAHDMIRGVAPRSLIATSKALWERDRRNGYAGGGTPWGSDQTWVPTVSGITAGRGAPQAPSLPSAPSAQQQKGLSNDQMKGIGTLGKAGVGGLSNWMNTGASDVSLADLGSATSPLPGLDAYDYEGGGIGGNEMFAARGGRIAGFADGGSADDPGFVERLIRGIHGGRDHGQRAFYNATRAGAYNSATAPEDRGSYGGLIPSLQTRRAVQGYDAENIAKRVRGYASGGSPLLEDDDVVYRPMAAGVGASRPAFDVVNPDEPFRMLDRPAEDSEPPALEGWRRGVDKDVGLGQSAQNDAPLPPEVISGRSKPPIMARGAPEEADEGLSTALGYSGAPRTISGVGAPPPQPEAAPNEGFLSRLGVRMTPELKQGLLQAGLSMMATRHGGAGSFLQSAGEAGMTGVGAYSQTQQLAQAEAEKARKEAFEREKFERPYSAMTAVQRAADRRTREAQDRPYNEMTAAQKAADERAREAAAREKTPFGWKVNDDGTITKVKGGPQDPETIREQAEAKQSGGISDAAVEVMARQGASGDQSWAKNIGRGAQSAKTIERVRNRMADILISENGKTPAEAAKMISEATRDWGASQIASNAGARTRATRVANLDMILEVADSAVPAALEASQKLSRTGFVPLNKIIEKGRVMTSNPEQAEFGIANLQLAEGWARAMNPTGVMRESDRDKALEFLGTATSADTYERAVKQIQKQIHREKDAISRGHSPKESAKTETGDIPSPKAIELLASDPKKYKDDFEKRYGKGSADRFGG